MLIFIPTKDRPDDQRAYTQLTDAGLVPLLVVDKSDRADYRFYNHVRVDVQGIAAKRQAIVKLAAGRKFAMVDDDMTIHAVDEVEGKCNIYEPDAQRVRREFDGADNLLDVYAHGGVHTRHFVNYAVKPYALNRGYYRQIMFFNPALMKKVPRYSGRTAEDVRFMIELLEQGLDYFLKTSCCMIEKKAANLESHFSQEYKNADMLALGAEYPGFVRKTKDGRITLSYSGILKAAKKRNALNV